MRCPRHRCDNHPVGDNKRGPDAVERQAVGAAQLQLPRPGAHHLRSAPDGPAYRRPSAVRAPPQRSGWRCRWYPRPSRSQRDRPSRTWRRRRRPGHQRPVHCARSEVHPQTTVASDGSWPLELVSHRLVSPIGAPSPPARATAHRPVARAISLATTLTLMFLRGWPHTRPATESRNRTADSPASWSEGVQTLVHSSSTSSTSFSADSTWTMLSACSPGVARGAA